MVPTRIPVLITPLLSAWQCGPTSDSAGGGGGGGGTNTPNRLFTKEIAFFLKKRKKKRKKRKKRNLLLSGLLCLKTSRSKYNESTINYLLFSVFSSCTLRPKKQTKTNKTQTYKQTNKQTNKNNINKAQKR